jgi:ligand-binding sensor domain-containing protein/signal transduction histidine kinase
MGRVLFAFACCTCAFALNPELDVSQYAHTSWKIRDGFPTGQVTSIAQTPDGYLWLGSEFGLFRFDGIKSTAWQPPQGQSLPDSFIRSLLVAHDGTVWIGTLKGLASWKDAKLRHYDELAGLAVDSLLEDRDGSVWASGLGLPSGKLCVIRNGVQCNGEDGRFGIGGGSLYEDHSGELWVGMANGLWRWKPGPARFYPVPNAGRIDGLGEGEDGALLIATGRGIRRLTDEKAEAYSIPGPLTKLWAQRLFRDRDGSLWIGTSDRGLVHVHQGRTDLFASADGLSGDNVYRFFQDREGSVWIATQNGLDRFRDFAVSLYSQGQGIVNGPTYSLLADRNGTVWLSTYDGLKHWSHGPVTNYREHARTRPDASGTAHEVVGSGLPGGVIESLFEDDRGRVWVATRQGFGYLKDDKFTYVKHLPGAVVLFMVQDAAGNLWIADQNFGLFQLSPEGEVQQLAWARLGRVDPASTGLADPKQGGVWFGFYQGGVAYFKDGKVRASYGTAEGLGKGFVKDLRLDPDGTLWAATQGGLSRLKNGRIATLTKKNGLPCDAVSWLTEDDAHSVWLYTACGLVRIGRSELDAWVTNPSYTVNTAVFDSSDGVRTVALAGNFSPQVTKSRDGKLWFGGLDGASVVDPLHLPFNSVPPPVQVEKIIVDRKTYATDAALKLPPLIRDLEIDYTALSFVAPEKVHFRYKLEGRDRDWQDAGNRRQAFYNDLGPRNYRFRVIAANNNGVWNEAGAAFDFSVAPAYYQTTWFQASCVAAFLMLLWVLYQLRVKQVERHLGIRMDERVNERTRIARDLHDTLLQSFQGVLLKFYAATFKVSDERARTELEDVIEQARSAIAEGRDAVQGLRSSATTTDDLALAMGRVGQELAAHGNGAHFDLQVVGAPRELVPIVRDEAYRIGCEALRNAFLHAQAKRIEAEIQYEPRRLQLRVRDNGKGIDPKVLKEGGRAGHHGIPGMHERAKLVGGKLAVWSELESGAEIELTIPGSVAYPKKVLDQESNGRHPDSDGR